MSKDQKKLNHNSIFKNPTFMNAKESLSEEDKQKYAIIGKDLYESIDFETTGENNQPTHMAEATAYVCESIKSGLHPSMLEDNEKALLADAFGNEWYKRYGYVKEDLDDIVTIKH